jgi:hypothetical protein
VHGGNCFLYLRTNGDNSWRIGGVLCCLYRVFDWPDNEEQLYSREYSVLLFSESSTGNSCCVTDVGGILRVW